MRNGVAAISLLCVGLLTCSTGHETNAPAQGNAITLQWDPPTTSADKTLPPDLAGFRIYRGSQSRTYNQPIVDVSLSSCTGTQSLCTYTYSVPDGTWYFAVTAYDTTGNESVYSNEVSKAVNVAPTGG